MTPPMPMPGDADALLLTWTDGGKLRARMGKLDAQVRARFSDLDALDVDELAGLRDLLVVLAEGVETMRVERLTARADEVRAQVAEQAGLPVLVEQADPDADLSTGSGAPG